MPREVITTEGAPRSGLYSQGVRAGGQVWVAGMVGLDVASGRLAEGVEPQVRQALANCEAVLAAAGAGLDDVVEVGVLLTHPADFDAMNAEYARWFPVDPPTRYVAKLGAEPPGVLVSVRMTAVTA